MKSASVYSETTTRSGRSATSCSMSAFTKRWTFFGTRPTTFDVPSASAQRVTETSRCGGRISTSTSSADRLIEATRCGFGWGAWA